MAVESEPGPGRAIESLVPPKRTGSGSWLPARHHCQASSRTAEAGQRQRI